MTTAPTDTHMQLDHVHFEVTNVHAKVKCTESLNKKEILNFSENEI